MGQDDFCCLKRQKCFCRCWSSDGGKEVTPRVKVDLRVRVRIGVEFRIRVGVTVGIRVRFGVKVMVGVSASVGHRVRVRARIGVRAIHLTIRGLQASAAHSRLSTLNGACSFNLMMNFE